MKHLSVCLFLVAMAYLSSPVMTFAAKYKTTTVQELLRDCEANHRSNPYQAARFGYCVGVAQGVLGGLLLNKKVHGAIKICSNSFISNAQVIQGFVNWAKKNPQNWQKPGVFGMYLSTYQIWGCK